MSIEASIDEKGGPENLTGREGTSAFSKMFIGKNCMNQRNCSKH